MPQISLDETGQIYAVYKSKGIAPEYKIGSFKLAHIDGHRCIGLKPNLDLAQWIAKRKKALCPRLADQPAKGWLEAVGNLAMWESVLDACPEEEPE